MSYLHGYGESEALRLRAQARVLAPWVMQGLPLRGARKVLEVGAGVGGQTELLLEAYPGLSISALERDARHHEALARWASASPERAGRVSALLGDGARLGEPSYLPELDLHDAAYFCWVLEHSHDPLALLAAARARLEPGALLVAHEVCNRSFGTWPAMGPVLARRWEHYNEAQRRLGGDPDVGLRLGALLAAAGYVEVETSALLMQLDDREPERRRVIFDYMAELLGSADDAVAALGLGTAEEARGAGDELRALGRTPGSVFHYTLIRATARAPGGAPAARA